MIASIGRIVHVRIGGTDAEPVLRPALIVRVWTPPCCNVQVFLDGSNDDQHGKLDGEVARAGLVVWCTSISEGTARGQWRWPAKA